MDPQIVVDGTGAAQGFAAFQIQDSSLGQKVLLRCRSEAPIDFLSIPIWGADLSL